MITGLVSPSISVIVPVRNGAASIERCLAALGRNPSESFEVIVVDDGSADATAALARAAGATVISNPVSCGPAAARNEGAALARGEILLFLDADVEVQPTTISRVLEEFERNPRLTALFGSYDDDPAALNFASQYRNLLHHFTHQTAERQSGSFWAGCGAIRRDVFAAIGGFDAARYPRPSTEDIELGLRLARRGDLVHLVPDLQVKHLKAWSGLSMMKADIVDRAVPWSQLILDEGIMPNDLNLRWRHRFSAVLSCLLTATLVFLALGHQRFYDVPARPAAAAFALLLLLQFVPLNWAFYAMLVRRRGWLFAARVLPAHLLYYLYSALTFAACWVWHHVRRLPTRRRVHLPAD